MLKALMEKFGFIHQSSVEALVAEKVIQEKENNLKRELDFNNRVFAGMPVIGINNYENAIEIGIVKHFELSKNKVIPIIKLYYSNRTDDFHSDKENCSFGQYVTFSEQRLKAYLKMDGCERTAMLIKGYQFSKENIESLAVLAPYQPSIEEVLAALNETTFFKDSEAYSI